MGPRVEGAKDLLKAGYDKSLEFQYPLAKANVERLRRVHPDKSPEEMIKHITGLYLFAVTSTGAGAGATAVAPLGISIPTAIADSLAFLEASVLYVLSVSEVYQLHPEDFERRKLLVTAVLMGDAASSALSKGTGKTATHWGKLIVKSIPMSKINQINKVLGPRFITKYGAQQGVLVLGKQVPLGLGIGIGGGGNHLVARGVAKATRKIMGAAPADWNLVNGDPEEEIILD